jgi:hypothetical protein
MTVQMECDLHDQIVPWSEVGEGDLVLQGNYLELVTAIRIVHPEINPGIEYVAVHLDGHQRVRLHLASRLTAVRRYMEHPAGEEPS